MSDDTENHLAKSQLTFRIESREEFDFLSDAYHTLFENSDATAFQSPLWLDQFYNTLLPNIQAQPLIIEIYLHGSQNPDVVLPLVREKHMGVNFVQPADLGAADYNAVVGSKENLTLLAGSPTFKKQLRSLLQPYDILLFRKQPPSVFDAGQLFGRVKRTPNVSSAYDMQVGSDYDGWFKSTLSKNMRKGLRRKRSGFEREVGELNFHELHDADDIREAFRVMRDLRAARYESDLLSQPAYFDFYLGVAQAGARDGTAATFVGKAKNGLMTVDFGLRHRESFLFLLGAFSGAEEHKKFSLGLIGLNEVIRQEAGRGLERFDLTIGDEPYKQSFGANKVPLTNLTVVSGLRGQVASMAYQSQGPLRDLLKKLLPNFN